MLYQVPEDIDMNEFTKDELNEILENIKQSEITVGAQRFHLVGKIQSLIDNYCEHDMYETSALINTCIKCQHSELINL
jgi:hypothetical protein